MRRLLRFSLPDGDEVTVEVDDHDGAGVGRAGRGGTAVERATVTYGEAMAAVRRAADATLRQFRELASQPDTVELCFGVKLTAEAGAVIARTEAEAHLTVRLTWAAKGA